jgi:hypothetical protein
MAVVAAVAHVFLVDYHGVMAVMPVASGFAKPAGNHSR